METMKDMWHDFFSGLYFSVQYIIFATVAFWSLMIGIALFLSLTLYPGYLLLETFCKPEKIVFITHTNIGIYKSKLEAKQLDQDERLKLARAIERYKRPKFDPPETEAEKKWIKDAMDRHKFRISIGYYELSNTGVWTEELGWFDEFASEVKLKDLHIENTERPE